MESRSEPTNDCTFLYFKPSGKWKYEGRGRYPRSPVEGMYHPINHDTIMVENMGMPGISSGGKDMVVVVIPDETCDVPTAHPTMVKEKI